jgi:hypothetical protein
LSACLSFHIHTLSTEVVKVLRSCSRQNAFVPHFGRKSRGMTNGSLFKEIRRD